MLATVQLLPDISGRRFSTVSLGGDAVQKIVSEHGSLVRVASLCRGVEASELTLSDVDVLPAKLVALREYLKRTGNAEALGIMGWS